jgi:hypothetical protein
LETYLPLGRSYFYRADASGQILDVSDADITDMVARGCVVDEFAREASGGASGITQLTGDVAAGPGSGSQATAIAANAVGNAKLAQMAAHTSKGNNGASTAAPVRFDGCTADRRARRDGRRQLQRWYQGPRPRPGHRRRRRR